MLGRAGCGKTAITNRIIQDTFRENSAATVGASFVAKPARGHLGHRRVREVSLACPDVLPRAACGDCCVRWSEMGKMKVFLPLMSLKNE
jgi:hypothetical protein